MPSLHSLRRNNTAFTNTQRPTKALKLTAAVEHGARMGAMDGATRRAGQLIKKVTLQHNRTGQTARTKELREIVGGAKALK
jgi:F-type H+-transporting ATPase subunit gamma